MVSNINTIAGSSAVQDMMLSYISEAIRNADRKYQCKVNTDEDWIKFGIARVLHKHGSGREFFQNLRTESLGESSIKRQDFQEGLKSKRRLEHLTSINKNYLTPRAMASLCENQGDLEDSLKDFHIYAADGHFHAASTHEPRDAKGRKNAIGHLYALNLRNRDMSHLALSSDGRRKKPHDMGTLKRMEIQQLRQGAKKGQKVLYVWDPACIDFTAWRHWKHNNGIYFLTKAKDNLSKTVIGELPFDRTDAVNSGILSDQLIEGVEALRMITYRDAETEQTNEFITNLNHRVSPGMIAQLYRMRWDIEKVFDEFKNKLDEKQAWTKNLTGKSMQAQFLVLTYNLLSRLHEEVGKIEPSIREERQKKADQRWGRTKAIYQKQKRPIPHWLKKLRRLTQLGVKFIRWVRVLFLRPSSWQQSLELLRYEYAQK